MNKKIIYLANMRLPNERPHGWQIMKTCEALKKQGAAMELWVAARRGTNEETAESTAAFYGLKEGFSIRRLPVWDFLPGHWRLGFYLESLSFFISAALALRKIREDIIVYTRDEINLFLVFFARHKIFWEAHMSLRSGFLLKSRMKRLGGIISISENLAKIISRENKVKIAVAPDAVDLKEFSGHLPKTEARALLGLALDKKTAVYSGGLFKQKGVFTLLAAAELLDDSWQFLIVGGNPGDEREKMEKIIKEKNLRQVALTGYIDHKKVPVYLAAADVLLLPGSNLDERTKFFTSPLKLFEYMGSARPIVATATPTTREVLNESNAILVEPDNPEALKDGLLEIFKDPGRAGLLAKNARRDAEKYTWDKRAEIILRFIFS